MKESKLLKLRQMQIKRKKKVALIPPEDQVSQEFLFKVNLDMV